ncbi:unnamed protein product [Periconia digitata]|uniref:Uncharacterized protein n=1 Tax=Periconia digitata TaxID=1303443 RepID=A0A9W4UMK9_9PLEO|nr:unnamed protein product [Periconia digitata]
MFISTTLTSGISDILDPKHRKINFAESVNQNFVVQMLRRAWTATPPPPETIQKLGVERALKDWVQDHKATLQKLDKAQHEEYDEGIAQNPDKEDVESEWRRHLVYMYNHLFYDIGGMLPETNCAMGHFHSPNSETWTISYDDKPSPDSEPLATTVVVVKSWPRNIVILPAFLDKGVEVTASREVVDESGTAGEVVSLGSFGARGGTCAWFVKGGMDVTFKVEVGRGGEDLDSERTGVAAVFAVGLLCTDPHGEAQVE